MKINKLSVKLGASLTISCLLMPTTYAIERPQTMEDMWKIIQAQQKQIDELKASTQTSSSGKLTASNNEVKQLERKTDVLTQEVEKLRTNLSIPEEAKYKSAYGLGPAASKIYGAGKGLSIGGYGEGNYSAKVGDKKASNDNADMERMVLYAGYKFTDNILFNSEIEFEHASTGEGSEEKGEVSVEFASLDFFINPIANVRAGLVLMPMGLVNRIHEPLFYFGNHRPEVERRIIPSTWSEMGVGLFGAITPNLTYTTYVVNGLNAANFSSNGIRDGRGGGSTARAENFGYVARIDYEPNAIPGLTVGGSGYVGNSGQNQTFSGKNADVFTQLYEAHVQWKYRGLEFRTLGSWGHVSNADLLTEENIARLSAPIDADNPNNGQLVGSQNYGFYSELGYDILPLFWQNTTQYLAPFFRYEKLNTLAKIPSGYAKVIDKDWEIYQTGLQYKPIPNVVIKADYRNYVARQGTLPDDFNLGFGFIF